MSRFSREEEFTKWSSKQLHQIDVYVDKKTSLEGNESIMENDKVQKAQVWDSNSTTYSKQSFVPVSGSRATPTVFT